MFLHLTYSLTSLVQASSNFDCPMISCERRYLGNSHCNYECNNILCNFDSPVFSENISNLEIFRVSDCFVSCLYSGCTEDLLENDECDEVCNSPQCAFDLGLCGTCSSGCTSELLYNKKCDKGSPCDNEQCINDLRECNICVEGCGLSDVIKDTCENEICRHQMCAYIKGNPCSDYCFFGCLHSQVNNGICEFLCSGETCDFDGNDCICSPGCTEEELQTECKGLSDPCNNFHCKYKNRKCGYFSPGCFYDMISNSRCNPECLNNNLIPDWLEEEPECSCAFDCFMIYIGNKFVRLSDSRYEQSCFVPDCWFNIQDSNDDFIRRSRILSSLIYQNYSFLDLDKIPEGCSEVDMKLFDMPDGPKCDITSPCYSDKALWCMGRSNNYIPNCLRATNTTCVICEGFMINNTCFNNLSSCPEDLDYNSNLTELFSSSSEKVVWCTKRFIGTGNNSYTIYVGPSDQPQVSGEGSIENPFLSLYQAFANISREFNEIKLFPGVFVYKYDSKVKIKGSDIFNPLFLTQTKHLIIEGLNSENRSEVYWSEGFTYNSKFDILKIISSKTIIIKNIIFRGDKILKDGCELDSDFCFYCPFFIRFRGDGLTDLNSSFYRNETFLPFLSDKNKLYEQSDFFDPGSQMSKCEKYKNIDLFIFNGETKIINVTFQSFRNQFNSLIKVTSTIELNNVDFIKLQPSSLGVVIDATCSNNCEKFNFHYIKGIVEDLNFGYEINNFIKTGGFLKIKDINSIEIIDINFKFNVAYSQQDASMITTFISIINFIGTLMIDSCSFSNLYVNNLIHIDTSSLKYNNLQMNSKRESLAYNQLHFQLSNSKFENIYSSNYFIRSSTQMTTQNVRIFNVEFKTIRAARSSIISLNFDGLLMKMDTDGEEVTINRETGIIKKRTVEIENIYFFEVKTGEFVIYIKRNPNVLLKNINIVKMSDGNQDSVSVIIDEFKENGKYLSITPRNDQVGDLICSGASKLEECYNLDVLSVYNEDIYCEYDHAPSGFIFYKISGSVNLNSSYFYQIISNSLYANLLSFSDIYGPLSIYNTSINDVNNTGGGLVEFLKCDSILLKDFKAKNVINWASPVIYVSDFSQYTMINSNIENIKNFYSGSGFLKLVSLGTRESTINILNSRFFDLKSTGGSGLFTIDPLGSFQSQNIFIKNVTFQKVSASQSVFLYTSRKLFINQSLISEIRGSQNFNSTSMIYDSHQKGILNFSDVEFKNNKDIHFPGIVAEYEGKGNFLELNNFRVFNTSKAEQVFQFTGTKIDEVFISFNDVFMQNVSSIVEGKLAKSIKLNDLTLIASRLRISHMSLAGKLSNAGLEVEEGDFQGLSETLINSQSQGFFKCSFCKIHENYGNLFIISSGSYIILNNSEVFKNFHRSQFMMIEIDSVGVKNNLVEKTVFKNNHLMDGKLFKLTKTNLFLVDSEFIDNFSEESSYSEIVTYETDLLIKNSTFSHSLEQCGSFIYSSLLGNLTIFNSSFFSGCSQQGGGAITIENCENSEIDGCTFKNNSSHEEGGAIKSLSTFTKITNSFFQGNSAKSGSDLSLSGSSYSIVNSNFYQSKVFSANQQFSIQASGDFFTLDQVRIINPDPLISALSCLSFNQVNISRSLISGVSGNEFGACFFDGSFSHGTLIIDKSTFEQNFCNKSGAGFFLSDMNLILLDSLISFNEAGVDGGGIFIQAPECKTCTFDIKGNTKMMKNKAKRNGGGIRWLNFKPNIDSTVEIFNNSASYGNDIAGVPSFIGIKTRMLEKTDHQFDYFIDNVPPGQIMRNLAKFYLFDVEGNLITTDNSSRISLLSLDKRVIIAGESFIQASSGIFDFSGFILKASPGSVVFLNSTIDSISKENVRNDNNDYKNNFIFKVQLRNCTKGEATDNDTCLVCSQGYYSIQTSDFCKPCPDGGICPGGSDIWVKPGFYRTSNESEVLYKCPFQDSCLGNLQGFYSQCLKGYSGITCSVCQGAYTKSCDGKCRECPDQLWNIFLIIFIFGGFFGLTAVLVYCVLRSEFGRNRMNLVFIRIFMNYLQIVYVTTEFELLLPNFVGRLMGGQKNGIFFERFLVSFDCYQRKSAGSDYEDIFYKNIIFRSIVPIIIFFISGFTWAILSRFNELKQKFRREVPLTISVMYILIHPSLTKSILSNFSCEEFDKIGSFLTVNYAIKCSSEVFLKYFSYITLPSLILWSFGIPFLTLTLIIKKRKMLDSENHQVLFGFLCTGYKTSKFYWQFLMISRNIVIICIFVLFPKVSIEFKTLSVALVLIFSIYLQNQADPFETNQLNKLEMKVIITALFANYCRIFYLKEEIGDIYRLVFFFMYILGNSYFVLSWIYWICVVLSIKNTFLRLLFKQDDCEQSSITEKAEFPNTFDDERYGNF